MRTTEQNLYIQVLDDSTDETTQILKNLVQSLQNQGHNIELLHRDSRKGYKAGALEEGLQKISSKMDIEDSKCSSQFRLSRIEFHKFRRIFVRFPQGNGLERLLVIELCCKIPDVLLRSCIIRPPIHTTAPQTTCFFLYGGYLSNRET